MAATLLLLIITWTTALLSAMGSAGAQDTVKYTIRNNADTYAFAVEHQMRPWAKMNMPIITDFIRDKILCGNTNMPTEIILQVEQTLPPPNNIAYRRGNTINMSAEYFFTMYPDPSERMSYFRYVMCHEMTHMWQFDEGYTAGKSPAKGLVEGIADYAAYKRGHTQHVSCRPTWRHLWYDGYCRTAYFLLYLEGHGYRGAVCKLNQMMETGYNETYFRVDVLGNRTAEDVWNHYVDNYVDPPPPRLLPGRRPHKNNNTADDREEEATY